MPTLSRLTSGLKLLIYSFGLFLVQVHFISRMPHPALRIDVLLLFVLGLAHELPPFFSLFWALFLGYLVDLFTGKFWGFHVISYTFTVLVVTQMSQKFELHNSFYQMILAALCALVQALVLMAFLWFDGQASLFSWVMWVNLGLRTIIMMLLAPLVVYGLSGLWESQ